MISRMREKMSGLSKKTKTVILKITMIVLIAISFLVILGTTLSDNEDADIPYDSYLKEYVQKYSHDQQYYNRFVFYLTQDNVIFSNKQLKENYFEEINSFANISEEEFQELYHIVTSIAKNKGYLEIAEFEDNYFYDWTDFLPPVKNMKDYDGAHIFAVTAAMEFEANKKAVLQERENNITLDLKDDFITLSEQQVIDCCLTCIERKLPKYVYYHFKDYGSSIDATYPYVNSIYKPQPNICKTQKRKKSFFLKDYYEISTCTELSQRLEFGPVVVAVDSRGWRGYEGGIYDGCSINIKRNHYALVVGRGIGYWKIRNSWGSRWGEHGHIRIKSGNSCGVCSRGSYLQIQ